MEKQILGILDCDDLAEELKADYGCYTSMFQALLRDASSTVQLRRYKVLEGQLPEDPYECSAYLISGSKSSVYDEVDWLPPVMKFVREAYSLNIKLVGICFGHQLLAESLGGKTQRSKKGWGVGAMTSERIASTNWMSPSIDKLRLLYSHQDQVVELPGDAECLFESEFCPIAGYHIPDRVLAFQGHPEFTRDYSARLMNIRKHLYAPGQYEKALESLSQNLDDAYIAKWIINFIQFEH